MKSVMTASHNFSQVPKANIERSTFDRSHGLKTTGDADLLNVLYVDEVLPGDTFKMKANLFGRLATPINPIMDNLYLDTFFFFVPSRLVWDNFKKFMGEQEDPGDSTDYTVPQRTGGTSTNLLHDQMGLPMGVTATYNVLPFRCYWAIFDSWFRDQNLQNSAVPLKTDSGTDIISNTTDYNWYEPTKRGKRHDYFTSCLPWTQKGDNVTIPLGSTADIAHDAADNINLGVYSTVNAGYTVMDTGAAYLNADAGTASSANKLYADLSTATGATINGWRQAFQIQKFLEKDARGGTRYIEKVYSHFGVTSPDARLQRPEYLGGSSQPINVNPVPQTSSTDATTPQGNMSAFGTVSDRNSGFTKSFTEHGYIIGLWNVRADITYQQGLERMWSRSTQYDFYFPTFAHLGEQAVLNKEIYAQGTADDDNVFGYQERYAEYRYKPSKITGAFRSTHASSLDPWHLSEEFSSLPTLSASFIESNTPLDRAIAVPAEPHLILDCFFDLKCTRPMPVYSPPGLIDHF
jgi:hypothetical protein